MVNPGDVKRIKRCKDCPCVMELPASKWFCDQYQKRCVDVIECYEWDNDPSIVKEK